jgi:hypothetical protein
VYTQEDEPMSARPIRPEWVIDAVDDGFPSFSLSGLTRLSVLDTDVFVEDNVVTLAKEPGFVSARLTHGTGEFLGDENSRTEGVAIYERVIQQYETAHPEKAYKGGLVQLGAAAGVHGRPLRGRGRAPLHRRGTYKASRGKGKVTKPLSKIEQFTTLCQLSSLRKVDDAERFFHDRDGEDDVYASDVFYNPDVTGIFFRPRPWQCKVYGHLEMMKVADLIPSQVYIPRPGLAAYAVDMPQVEDGRPYIPNVLVVHKYDQNRDAHGRFAPAEVIYGPFTFESQAKDALTSLRRRKEYKQWARTYVSERFKQPTDEQESQGILTGDKRLSQGWFVLGERKDAPEEKITSQDGKAYVAQGHTRLGAQILAGRPEVLVRVFHVDSEGQLLKFNPNHDEQGRFASGDGGGKLAIPTFEEFVQHGAENRQGVDGLYSELKTNTYANPSLARKESYLRGRYAKAAQKLENLSFPLTVYRKVRLKDMADLRVDQPGLSWSMQQRKAQVVFGSLSSGKDYLLKAEIEPEAVNVPSTIYWQMHPIVGDEDEICTNSGASFHNLSIRVNNEWKLLKACDAELLKFNPNHDEKGKSASGDGSKYPKIKITGNCWVSNKGQVVPVKTIICRPHIRLVKGRNIDDVLAQGIFVFEALNIVANPPARSPAHKTIYILYLLVTFG